MWLLMPDIAAETLQRDQGFSAAVRHRTSPPSGRRAPDRCGRWAPSACAASAHARAPARRAPARAGPWHRAGTTSSSAPAAPTPASSARDRGRHRRSRSRSAACSSGHGTARRCGAMSAPRRTPQRPASCRGFSSTFGVGLPGSASEYFGKSGRSSMREVFWRYGWGRRRSASLHVLDRVARHLVAASQDRVARRSSNHRARLPTNSAITAMTIECQRWAAAHARSAS